MERPALHVLAIILRRLSMLFTRLAHAVDRTLPALLPVKGILGFIQDRYTELYREEPDESDGGPGLVELAAWERLVLDRYKIDAGRLLVMGAGWGRESIAIARRGVSVVGLDNNRDALRQAGVLARREPGTAVFHQGDFLAPPYRPGSFDCVLLSCNMYSSIPGRMQRQAWLAEALNLLRPDGTVVASFLPRLQPISRARSLSNRFNQILMRLPGANREYQVGDICYEFVYLHEFQDQNELREELARAGARILEMNWDLGYAVAAK